VEYFSYPHTLLGYLREEMPAGRTGLMAGASRYSIDALGYMAGTSFILLIEVSFFFELIQFF